MNISFPFAHRSPGIQSHYTVHPSFSLIILSDFVMIWPGTTNIKNQKDPLFTLLVTVNTKRQMDKQMK